MKLAHLQAIDLKDQIFRIEDDYFDLPASSNAYWLYYFTLATHWV